MTVKRIKKLSDYERYSTNILVNIDKLRGKFKYIDSGSGVKPGSRVINLEGKIDSDKILTITKRYLYDTEKFTKVFNDTNAEWFDFSRNTSRLLGYIINKCLIPDTDKFNIDYREAAKALGRNTPNCVFDSLVELLDKKIILRASMVNQYWINVHLIFNGSRVKYVKVIERGVSSEMQPLPEISYE
jgi:hypothetical protein